MSNLTYVRPGGVWNTDTDLLASEMAVFDAQMVRAMSGDGGVYYLLDPLVIGGAAGAFIEFGADTTFEQNTYLNGSAIFNDQFYVGPGSPMEVVRSATFYENVRVDGEMLCDGDFTANQDIFLNGGVLIYGASGFYNDVAFELGSDPVFNALTTFNNGVIANQPVICNSTVYLGDSTHTTYLRGPTELQGPLRPTGSVGRVMEPGQVLPNSDATIDIRNKRHFFVPASVSASRIYSVSPTGIEDGDWIMVTNRSASTQYFQGSMATGVLPDHGFKAVRVDGQWQEHQWKYTT